MTPVIERLKKLQDVLADGRATDRSTAPGSIVTAERRTKIEQEMRGAIVAATDIVDSLARDGMDLDPDRSAGRIADAQSKLSAAYKERDRIATELDDVRARLTGERDELVETVALYEQTNAHLPIVGLTCDGDECQEAVGIVGVKVVDLDSIVPALVTIAQAAGWTIRDVVADHDAGTSATTKHLCRKCST